MRSYSSNFRREISSISRPSAPLLLLEINHADLATPVRVVNDNQDLVSNGNTFTALGFHATLPDDLSQGQPRAQLFIDNVGRELTQWIESSGGAEGATVRMIQVRRADPDTIEWEVTMDLTDVSMDANQITGTLSFTNLLDVPGIAVFYRPENTPGLF